MNAEHVICSQGSEQSHVCPWQHVYWFDNFLRPLVHNPRKLFEPYVRPGMTVLDVGCGRGFASLGLARLVGEDGLVVSADLQPEMLQMVKQRAKKAGLSDRIRIHHCHVDRIGIHERFDFVLAFMMVHEAADTLAFLKEVFTMLKPGGRFFIAEPKAHVSHPAFKRTVEQAQEIGLTVREKPRVLLGRAAVLSKDV